MAKPPFLTVKSPLKPVLSPIKIRFPLPSLSNKPVPLIVGTTKSLLLETFKAPSDETLVEPEIYLSLSASNITSPF